ncbi:MAG: hypothetical protein QW774_04155 [Candidatus Micrarchaeaceae archaeon]
MSCPSNTTCGNSGVCTNGNIFWACKFSNGTPLVAPPIKLTTTTATTTSTTTVPKPAITTIIATTTVPQHVYPVGNPKLYVAIVIAVIVIVAAFYYFLKRNA